MQKKELKRRDVLPAQEINQLNCVYVILLSYSRKSGMEKCKCSLPHEYYFQKTHVVKTDPGVCDTSFGNPADHRREH